MSWRRFLKRRWWDDERAREIAAYLETETADNIARGMPPAEAAAAARRKFGNPGLVREEIYRMNTIGWQPGHGPESAVWRIDAPALGVDSR